MIKKKRLIILEGPAGSGKTTLSKCLYNYLRDKGYNVGIIPEFSNNEIGLTIKNNSVFEKENPLWLNGFGGVLIFLGDKINLLKELIKKDFDFVIMDRFITSQYILGLPTIEDEREKEIVKLLIMKTEQYFKDSISAECWVFNLTLPEELIIQRLMNRIGRKLTPPEISSIQDEVKNYKNLQMHSTLDILDINNQDIDFNQIFQTYNILYNES